MEALGALGIDFKLLIAQIINFVILIAILIKILYKPVLKTLEDRKKRIEESLKKAEEIDRKVITVESECKARLEETRKDVDTFMEDAKSDAEGLRKEILAAGETEAAQIKSSAEVQIQAERSRLYDNAKSQAGKIALLLMAKAFQYDQGADFYKKSVDMALKDMESKQSNE
jgi:F-type H+-transporting ATPase subunit b